MRWLGRSISEESLRTAKRDRPELIKNLRLSGLLSFGPEGVDLPLQDLNVLIGPNGSGKSNLLEMLSLLRAAPTNLPEPVKEMGGVRQWMWKGPGSPSEGMVEAVVHYPSGDQPLRHSLSVADHGGRFEIANEAIANEHPDRPNHGPFTFYNFQRGDPILRDRDGSTRRIQPEHVKSDQSILSQVRDPERYPGISWLQDQYEQIHLFRNWSFGPAASLRREQSTHSRSDFLSDGGRT
jgi:predicted ATPase